MDENDGGPYSRQSVPYASGGSASYSRQASYNDFSISEEPEPSSLPMPFVDERGGRTVRPTAPPLERQRCERGGCVQVQRKLGEALSANRAWERRYEELHDESLRYAQDLERRLRQLKDSDDCHPDKQRRRQDKLKEELAEERQRNEVMKRRVDILEEDLKCAKDEVRQARSAASRSQDERSWLEEQAKAYENDFYAERRERQKIEKELEALREELIVAQQRASTNQKNFLAARREKDELVDRLRSLANPLPTRRIFNEPAGCSYNGYGYDETD